MARRSRAASAQDAYGAASTAIVLSVIYAVGGVIAGVYLGFQTRDSDCSTDAFSGDRTCAASDHPYIGLGIGIAFGAFFTAAVVVMIAEYIHFRTAEHLRG